MEALADGVHYHTLFWQFLPGRDRVLRLGADSLRSRNLGAYQRRQFQLAGDRAAAACAGPEHSGADHRPYRRRTARPDRCSGIRSCIRRSCTRSGSRIPYKIWPMSLGPDHRLDPRQHRAVFLAADESVFQARRAVSAGGRGAGADPGAAGFLSGRTRESSRSAPTPQWQAENLSPRQVGTPAEQQTLDDIADYFLIGYLGLIGLVLLARGARALNERRGGMISLSYGNGRTCGCRKA